jgi:hypothetical protein
VQIRASNALDVLDVHIKRRLSGGAGNAHFQHVAHGLEDIVQQAAIMLRQLGRGVHANPPLAIVGPNPPVGSEVFGADVFGVVYGHEDDPAGIYRVHLFGKGGKWRETRRGGVELYDLPSASGVYMAAEGEGRVVMQHRRGLPIVREY